MKQSLGINEGTTVLRDKQTGVLYLFYTKHPYSGLTVMLDQDGKPAKMNYSVNI